MPLFNIPGTKKDNLNRAVADVQQELPAANPGLRNTYLFSIVKAFVGRIYEFYLTLDRAVDMLFANTATGDALIGWGAFKGLTKNTATQATGNAVFTGTAGTTIPLSTELKAGDNTYETNVVGSIANQVISITGITRSGSTATATTASDHGLASNIELTISGADQTEYNGAQTITVTAANEFTYEVTGTPVTPATGTILATLDFVSIPVRSIDFGQSTNLAAGTELKLATTISGANNSAYVDFGTVGGGTDAETDDEFRPRVHDVFRFPVAYWNNNFIKRELKKIPGITRVFIVNPGDHSETISITSLDSDVDGVATAVPAVVPTDFTGATRITITGANESQFNKTTRAFQRPDGAFVYPLDAAGAATATGTIELTYSIAEPGVVTIYFLRDNDDSPIPDGSEVSAAKAALIEVKPADRYEEDVIVLAPVAVPVNFVFTALSPNTTTMKNAIEANLAQLFDERTSVSQDLAEADYICAINDTVDTQTGQVLGTFALSTPSGDITIATGEIPTLGTVTFP